MDSNILASILGGNNPANAANNENRPEPPKNADHELAMKFAKLLDQEEKKMDKTVGQDDKPEDIQRAIMEKQQEVDEEQTSDEDKKKAKEKMIEQSPLLNYIYNLMYKDPSALSNSERRMAGLDRNIIYQQQDIQYNQLKQMMSQRGMKLSDLSFVQMSKLAQTKNAAQVNAYLDQLSKELKTKGPVEKDERTLVERGKEAMAKREAGETETSSAEDMKKAMEGKPAKEADQAEKLFNRRQVMDDIIRKIDLRNLKDQTQMVMKLNPEYLGDLKLMISMKDDKMQASFETTSKEVRDLISDSVDELAGLFTRKGLKIGATKVKLVESIS